MQSLYVLWIIYGVQEPGAENLKGRELFTKVYYVGRVKPYTRSNGSIDYGVVVRTTLKI